MGELGRGEIGLFKGCGCRAGLVGVVVVVLVRRVHHFFEATEEGFQLRSAGFVGAEEVAPVFVCFSLFYRCLLRVGVVSS